MARTERRREFRAFVEAHAQALLRLEKEELERLFVIHQEARLELLGRLSSLPGEKFTAQQTRIALAQVTAGMRAMLTKLGAAKETALGKQLEEAIEQTLAEISFWEPTFKQAQGRIATQALRKLARPRGLLLQQYQNSMNAYGSQLVGQMQRRLAVHALEKSTIRDVSIDIAGRLTRHGFRGARFRAERIARTEMIDALSTGHQAALVEAKELLPDLKRQWDAHLDARTSDICESLNGQVKRLDEAWTWRERKIAHPPAHPNCRSRLVPHRAEWETGA